jgi:predicted phosphoribosyltransferase
MEIMVVKRLQNPINQEQACKVAALTAAGLPTSSVMRRAGITPAALRDIKARPDWEILIANAEQMFETLLKGGTI